MSRRKNKGDVAWYCGKYKKPIAYSTVAANDLICMLYQDGYTTPREILEHITYDVEAKQVMQKYIDKGFGDISLKLRY